MIPDTICNATYLNVLDLSNNHLTGRIPRCLIQFGDDIGVLNLANNRLGGQIEGTLSSSCHLNTLDLHGNSLNSISKLQILDIAHNNFSGVVPPDFFRQWGAMMTDDHGDPSSKNHLSFKAMHLTDLYYQDSVTVTRSKNSTWS
ncbi:receptor-like protein 12 [Tanacetum coccineum]